MPDRDDDTLLDDLLDQCVEALLAGRNVDLAALLEGRTHLRGRAEETLALARRLAASRTEPALAKRTIAGLEVERELGRGAAAIVYLVRQPALGGRTLALKVLTASIAQSDRERRRFLSEARALARLRHQNVVPVLDVIDEGGVLGYTMPHIRGATLAQRIAERARTQDTAVGEHAPNRWVPFVCRAGVALARALAAVHAASMLHRDVKPSNVLIDSDGSVFLSDFGLVRDPDASLETRTGAFLGTLAYAAPEQLRGETTDARADVYGLGATLYHALTLQLPARGTPAEIVATVEQGAIAPLRRVDPRLPRDLEVVVGKAMARAKEQRYATAQEFGDDLQHVIDLQPVRARAPSVIERVARRTRRHRGVALAGIVGALGALATIAAVVAVNAHHTAQAARAIEALREAQLALLDPDLRTRVQMTVRGLDVSTAPFVDSIESALQCAERAATLTSAPQQSVVLRDVLRAARARLRGEAVPQSATLAATCPYTERAFHDAGAEVDLTAMQPSDLRAFGIAGYLAGNFARAVAALEAAESPSASGPAAGPAAEPDDPFTDGLLGQLHLALGRPERAYPRLLRVAQRLAAPHLFAAAADAAVRCGDAAVASQMLAHARGSTAGVPFALIARIEADLLWLGGRGAEALAAYDQGLTADEDQYLRRTQYLEVKGETARALTGYINLAGITDDKDTLRGVLRTARALWASWPPAQRRAVLLAELAGERAEPGSMFGALAVARRARATLLRDEQAAAPAFTLDAARASVVRAAVQDAFDELAERVMAAAPDLARCADLTQDVRAQLVDAWLDPGGGDNAARLLAEHDACVRDGATFLRTSIDVQAPWRVVAALPSPQFGPMVCYCEPLNACADVDGDGHGDVLLHTRGATTPGTNPGAVLVCSGATGALLHTLRGTHPFEQVGVALTSAVVDGRMVWAAGSPHTDDRSARVLTMRGVDAASIVRFASPTGGASRSVFGHAIAWLVDQTAAGGGRIAVGAPGLDTDGRQAGCVYLFQADGTLEREVGGRGPHDSLGEYLAALGDLDGDGAADVAAGTLHRVGGSGYVLVISARTGRVLFEFTPEADEAGEGMRVAGPGDVDGDGTPDVAVAWSPHARRLGRAVVLSGRTGRAVLSLTGARAFDGFGADVTGAGDLDGDGRADLAVSAWSEGSLFPPCVYLFNADGLALASAKGVWRLRRLPAPPLGTARFAALALGAWTRYADVPLAAKVNAAVIELDCARLRR